MFYGYEIDGIEIDNMTKRLETLQKKLKADDKVYAQGYGKGTLIEDRIKIVDDDELAMIRLDVGLSTFKNLKNMNLCHQRRDNALKEAKQNNDPVALAKHRLDYNIKLGYALKVMKPEDRAAFRQSVEEMTGMKSKHSDEELFKRGVASKMISEKVRLLSKQNKGSLTKQEEKLLANLKGVVINPDSNGYDDLMKDMGGMQVTDIFRACMAYAGFEEESALERRYQFKNVAGEFAKEVEAAVREGNAPLEKENKVPVAKEENKVKEEQADIAMQLV